MRIQAQSDTYSWRIAINKMTPEHAEADFRHDPPRAPDMVMPISAAHHYKIQHDDTGRGDNPEDSEWPDLLNDIKSNGMRRPLHISTDGKYAMLGDGHHRLNAATQLGMSHVPVSIDVKEPGYWENEAHWEHPIVQPLEQHLSKWLRDRGHYVHSDQGTLW